VGCAEPNFWDTMTPFYRRLPNVVGFDAGEWLDPVGFGLTGLAAVAAAAHGTVEVVRHRQGKTASVEDKAEQAE